MTAPPVAATPLFVWGSNVPQPDHRDIAQEVADAVALGFNAYHLAVDWASVEPQPGAWDDHVLRHLRGQLLALRQAGIEPILTLYRGAEPPWFRDARGWLRGDAVQLFCRFVVKVVEEVGDLVTLYITIEVPTRLALRYTRHPGTPVAPPSWGLALSAPSTWALRRTLRAFLHAHGAARRTLHEAIPHHGVRPAGAPLVGITHLMHSVVPRRAAAPLDCAAAAAAGYLWNTLPLHVLVDGRFHAPLGHGESLRELRDSLDFIALMLGTRVEVPSSRGPGHQHAGPTSGGSVASVSALLAMISRANSLGKPLLILDDALATGSSGSLEVHLNALTQALDAGYRIRGWLFPPLSPPPPGSRAALIARLPGAR